MFDLSWGAFALVALGLTQVIIMLVTLYFHRACAHRSVEFSPGLNRLCRFLAWFLISMDPREFAAVHRKHHAFCDTQEDPHSPVVYGWHGVLFNGLGLYRKETAKPETIEKYGKGLPVDPWEDFYRKYQLLGIGLLAVVLVALMGWKGALLWAMMMAWIPFWAAGVVNGLGHHIGYRNYRTDDLSTNLSPWGLWIGGEELHNNHHAYPASPKFSMRAWEIDLGWGALKVLERLGLARMRPVPAPVLASPAMQQFLRDRHAWTQEFHKAAHEHAAHLLKKYGYSSWKKFSIGCEAAVQGRRPANARLAQAMSDAALARILKLERDLFDLWRVRGHLAADTIEAWKRQAHDLGCRALDDFARRLPAPALATENA